jgi:hypothetical protein
MRSICFTLLALMAGLALAQEPDKAAPKADNSESKDAAPPTEPGVKSMSGMSILGNEEAPKALVIVPWKSSRIGDEVGVANAMDERARPVDKDVFRREVRYYDLRSAK